MIVQLTIASTLAWGAWKFLKTRGKGPSYMPAPKGDAMAAIAARFGVPVEVIVAANPKGFARFYAPDGSAVSFKLPKGVQDSGVREGAQGKYTA